MATGLPKEEAAAASNPESIEYKFSFFFFLQRTSINPKDQINDYVFVEYCHQINSEWNV